MKLYLLFQGSFLNSRAIFKVDFWLAQENCPKYFWHSYVLFQLTVYLRGQDYKINKRLQDNARLTGLVVVVTYWEI